MSISGEMTQRNQGESMKDKKYEYETGSQSPQFDFPNKTLTNNNLIKSDL